MKTLILSLGALALAACSTTAMTPQAAAFDPAATTFTGWARVQGGEFQLYPEQRQLREGFSRPCISGALPRNAQDTARDLNGSQVEFTGRAVAWSQRGDRSTINHEGSLITNQCQGDYVIQAQSVRVLR